jgi:hypothetical protein
MTVPIRQRYPSLLSFKEQLLYVLSQLKKALAGEIAIELMKLQGVSTEKGVADLTIHTEKQLERLCADGRIETVGERHERKRYKINNKAS